MHAVTLLAAIRPRLSDGPVALATVLEVGGSVPRRPGAMMAVSRQPSGGADFSAPLLPGPHGTLEAGTVGGGAMEGRILAAMHTRALADVVDQNPMPERLDIDLHGTPDEVRDGICGGTMRIEVRTLLPRDASAIDHLIELGAAGEAAVVSADAGGLAVGRLEAIDGGASGAEDKTRVAAGSSVASAGVFAATAAGWRHTIAPRPLALVVGGGHCGIALARQLLTLEFDVVVEDDRADVRDRLRAVLPSAVQVVAGPTHETLTMCAGQRPVHAALVTRSFRQDVDALDALRRTGASSIGVMGSRRRLGTVLGLLRERGWTAEATEALDAPIGVDLRAETPEEIAVSIAAELIEHRASGAVRFPPAD
ncbi:MAG: XdhC family protein [Phycisphaerales bacterium]